ncbi:MAG: hypothetical protein J6Y28_09605 [Acholeplasmatales bacterium]|nr:hypothetical protein [Methanobrevibacter sp.]MBP5446413.1 hypothetical protein [Acholeplasmatales bacterium]
MKDLYKNTYLYFDEGPHKYTDSNGNEYISVTTIIGNYVPKFDTKYWAHKKAKEQGVSEKEIIKQWDKIKKEACDRGTVTHNGIEDAIKEVSKFKEAIKYLQQVEGGRCITIADIPGLIPVPLDIDKFIEATNNKYEEIYRVFKFYVEKGYTIYSEIGVFDPSILLSGTIDIFCYRPTDFVILDWKTNRDGLKFESGYYKKDKTTIPNQLTNEWVRKSDKMRPPLNHLDECNGSHYTMQLSIYARLAERILEIPCKGLGLCHIGSPFILNSYGQPLRDKDGYHVDPDGEETVTWYRINYLRNEADAVFKDRSLAVKAYLKQNQQLQLNLF